MSIAMSFAVWNTSWLNGCRSNLPRMGLPLDPEGDFRHQKSHARLQRRAGGHDDKGVDRWEGSRGLLKGSWPLIYVKGPSGELR